ncbi:MAG: ABC transporter substrate-binding protein [Rhodospirillaceae bacterium]|nr:ABC transporter substrate-binding protein [Rhodospirillaceae bacterium]
MLDWFVNPDHAPIIIAKQLGYFRDVGLDVEVIAPADPNLPPKLVAAKEVDIALTYQPQLHLLAESGLPIVRIGTLIETPLNALVALKKGPIKTIADLKGRKIGYSISGFEDAILGTMLQSHGLSLKDVTLINVNFALSPALLSRQVDAVIGAFRNFELNQMDLEKHPGIAFYPEENGVPVYDELVYITHQQRLGDTRIRRFLDAVERSALFSVNHTKAAWTAFTSYDKGLNTELNRRAWRDTLPRIALRPLAVDRTRYVRFAEYLFKQKLIGRQVPIDRYVVSLN